MGIKSITMKIYISLRMSEVKESASRSLADRYQKALEILGHQVFNPWVLSDELNKDGMKRQWLDYIAHDISVIKTCDAIMFCEDKFSDGMIVELIVAKKLGLEIFYSRPMSESKIRSIIESNVKKLHNTNKM